MELIKPIKPIKPNFTHPMKPIYARLWALWGLVSFVATFLIIILPALGAHLFKNKIKGQEYFIAVSKIWMNLWLRMIGCSVHIYGKEHFKLNENYIVVFNHNALLDIPLSAPFVPGANKTIGKATFSKVPLFGAFYRLGAILVDRKNERSRARSYEMMRDVLNAGMHMCIYPEGTRNRTNQPMKPFYDGAFRLSVETGKHIIPCIIRGTAKAMPIDKPFYLLPTKLSMTFLPPVSPDELRPKELNEKVYKLMLKELDFTNHKNNVYDSP